MRNIYLPIICQLFFITASAQYISNCQLPDNDCPTVCPGSTLTLEVYNIQNLNVGDTLQAWLSNGSGSFSSGTTTLSSSQYSYNNSTWTSGPFLFSSDVTNLYFTITIPASLPAGNSYLLKMKSSSGYVSGESFTCGGAGNITVTAAYSTLPPQPLNTVGTNQWIGHVYTWVPVDSTLTGTAFTNAQDFFDIANYLGYFLEDSLSFNTNYLAATGGTCPGDPGVLNNGTSIPCYQGYADDFSIRLLRTENFAPGMYQFSIQGDDGIRFSIDSGSIWLLNTFVLETFDTSLHNTSTNYPNGICMSGPTNLVIEYFQHLVDAQLAFTATLLSSNALSNAGNQSACTGGNVNFDLAGPNGYTYQWYCSTNNGASYAAVTNSDPFSGATTSNLSLGNVSSAYNKYLFYCAVTGLCSSTVNTPVDTLFVGGAGATVGNPGNQTVCAGGTATFNLSGADSLACQWYCSTDGGDTFNPVTNSSSFTGANTSSLVITNVPSSYNNYLFRCIVSGLCGGNENTTVDTLLVGGSGAEVNITTNNPAICAGDSTTICAPDNCVAYNWSNHQTTACITTSLPGNYAVTVTYSGGCTSNSNTINISIYPALSVSTSADGDTIRIYSGSLWQWYSGDSAISGATDSIFVAGGPGTYSVLITDTDGCTAQSNPIHIGSTEINEIVLPLDFTVYPNPITENCIISINSLNLTNSLLQVLDELGQLILETKIETSNCEIDMSHLNAGVYFFRLGNAVRKVVKE